MRKIHEGPAAILLPLLAIIVGGLTITPSLQAQTCSMAGYWSGTFAGTNGNSGTITATFTESGTSISGTVTVTDNKGTQTSSVTGNDSNGAQTFGPVAYGNSIVFASGAFSGCSTESGSFLLSKPTGPKVGSYTINAPILSVTGNGAALDEGDCTSISDAPAMPTITAVLSGSGLTGSVDWSLDVQYTGPDSPPTTYSFDTPIKTQPVADTWKIPFETTFIGGDAKLTYTYHGVPKTFSFCIDGENPSTESVKTSLGNSPWYLVLIAEAESTPNLYQFNPSDNTPYWTNNHGFGIMQIDPPKSQGDLFSWTVNVSDGKKKATSARVLATKFWTKQVDDYKTWASKHSGMPPPPANMTVGGNGNTCTFSYSPNTSQHPFSDGLGIQAYNSATKYFIYWDDVTDPADPMWVNNGSSYVTLVCSQPS
jgi:hypothetical protein